MTRSIAPEGKRTLEAQESGDGFPPFRSATPPLLPQPLGVVSDVMVSLGGGEWFRGLPFGLGTLSAGEGPPMTELRMQNVDARIGRALLGLNDRAQVSLEIRSSADFDLSQNPRVEIPGGSVIYAFAGFDLIDVTGTVAEISGRVMLRDYSQEPWPGLRATQTRCPGLFR